MAKDYAGNFYTNKAWRKCRAAFIAERIAIDGGRCQMCKEEQGYIVHHTEELNVENIKDAEVSLNHRKLMYLCKDCHNKIHGNEKPRCILTADGTVCPPMREKDT